MKLGLGRREKDAVCAAIVKHIQFDPGMALNAK